MLRPIVVGSGVVVPLGALSLRATRASGPGGQNVNKVASKVELRVDLARIDGLDGGARVRLGALAAPSLDAEGFLLVTSQLTRDQQRNIDDALDKVRRLVAQALVRPRSRRATRPTRGSVERRIEDKKRRARLKEGRRRDDR
ncbi:MAG: alternative ribosome rescue aminoacyl-tRNA hydrolase ArfB [Polyangiaceae bacterium]